MEKRHRNSDVDLLAVRLLKTYSDHIHNEAEDIPLSPYFLARLRTRIASVQERQIMNVWEYGVVSAQKWLVAFSLLAVLFFVGNLVAFALKPSFSDFSNQNNYSTDLEDNDYNEESLNVYDPQQE